MVKPTRNRQVFSVNQKEKTIWLRFLIHHPTMRQMNCQEIKTLTEKPSGSSLYFHFLGKAHENDWTQPIHLYNTPKQLCQTVFLAGDFFRSEFFGGVSKGGSHPRTHHSNFNHIPLNDIHIVVWFHTIAYTHTPRHHHTPHTHTYAYTHTYTHTHTRIRTRQKKLTKKHTIIHNTKNKKWTLFLPFLSRVCTHTRDTPLFWVFSVWFNTKWRQYTTFLYYNTGGRF